MQILYTGAFKSGKTTKLISHYKDLIITKEVSPDEILFLSINEKIIREKTIHFLKDFVEKGFEELWIDNYSSFCRKILKKHFLKVNMPPNFEVLSGLEERLLLENIASRAIKLKHFAKVKIFPGFINSMVDVFDLIKLNEQKFYGSEIDEFNPLYAKSYDLRKLYGFYKNELKKKDVFDYRDLLIKIIELFDKRPEICDKYKKQFKYIIIDQLEEVTSLEYKLIVKLFYKGSNSIIGAAHAGGSIYRFRGAQSEYFVPRFIKEVQCEQHNLPKSDHTIHKELNVFSSQKEEITFAARKIRDLIIKKECNFSDIAVLQRGFDNNSIQLYNEIFTSFKIPFSMSSANNIFSHPVVILIIFTLKFILWCRQSNKKIEFSNDWITKIWSAYIKNKHSFKDFVKVKIYAESKKKNLYIFILSLLQKQTEPSPFLKDAELFVDMLENFRKDLSLYTLPQLVYKIIENFGLWEKSRNDNNVRKVLTSFYKVVKDFEAIEKRIKGKSISLDEFIRLLDKMLSSYTIESNIEDNNSDTVKIMTLQKSKGQYYKYVFLLGLAEGILPRHYRENSLFSNKELSELKIAVIHDAGEFLDQEQKLFELGLSRAEKCLYLSYAKDYGSSNNYSLSSLAQINSILTEERIAKAENNIYLYEHMHEYDMSLKNVQTEKEFDFYKIKNGFSTCTLKYRQIKNEFLRIKNILENFTFSASSLKMFKDCPSKFMFKYLIGIEPFKIVSFIFGSLIHGIFEEFHKIYPSSYQDDKQKDEQDLLKLNDKQKENYFNNMNNKAYEIIDDKFEEKRDEFQTTGEMEWYRNKAKRIIASYIEDIKLDTWNIVYTEKKFDIELDGYKFRGQIDRIDKDENGNIEIIDYKTGKSGIKMEKAIKTALEKGDDYQMLIYYYTARELFGDIINKLSYYWLEKEKTARSGKKATLEIEKEEIKQILDKAYKNLINDLNKIKKSSFPKTPKSQYTCKNCSYEFLCE